MAMDTMRGITIASALGIVLALTGGTSGAAMAQDGGAATDLQVAAQNPIADLVSLPFQENLYFGGGLDEPLSVLNIQPVFPVAFNDRWNVIFRPILPVISAPGAFPGDGRTTGLGDLLFETFLSPSTPLETGLGSITWGVGSALTLPTHTDDGLGSRTYSAGPAFVAFIVKAPFSYGFLAFNQWSFAGPQNAPDVNQLVFQPFVNFNLSDGWSLQTSPVVTVDWTRSDDNVTLPIGGGVSKLTTIGKQPVKFSANLYYNALRPDSGPEWQSQFQVTLLFPK
ncbi:neuromedin U [Amorphus orientalis]|uniref:Neuromedin U n=1 Tax=Amorphus orientalis TaxID=649198 RepID=A0AAE3VQX7_9HYPH|nr:neuromedin U [Amorphus orientalis]MDQ0316116.1 hypothetical protein [Amorphus orientalis]